MKNHLETLRAASMFSGIGGAELALPEAQWQWCAEIEPFPSAVLAQRFGHPNLGNVLADDFIDRARSFGPLDLLCGGPPCQAFSIAGNRLSMADPRGNLSLRFIQVAHAIRPRNVLVENVPGWLNTPDNAFGCFLAAIVGGDGPLLCPTDGSWPNSGMVAGPAGKVAWRVLDAQYAGLAQRRRRVFAVVDFGDGADPASVLFERKGLFGDHPPRRETGQGVTHDVAPSLVSSGRGVERAGETRGQDPIVAVGFGGGNTGGPIDVAACLTAKGQRIDFEVETFVAHTLRGEGFDASEDGTGRGTPLVPVCYDTTHITSPGNWSNPQPGDPCHPVTATAHVPLVTIPSPVAYHTSGNCGAYATGNTIDALTTGTDRTSHVIAMQAGMVRENPNSGPDGKGWQPEVAYTLVARSEVQAVATQWAVRRLTPTECERLQGYPDGHTLIEFGSRRSVAPDMAAYLRAKGVVVEADNLTGKLRTNAAADGPRYKALGNAWAVACVRPLARKIMTLQEAA